MAMALLMPKRRRPCESGLVVAVDEAAVREADKGVDKVVVMAKVRVTVMDREVAVDWI